MAEGSELGDLPRRSAGQLALQAVEDQFQPEIELVRVVVARLQDALSGLIEAGQLTPVVGDTYPLAEVPDAVRHLEAGQARGKIAITI